MFGYVRPNRDELKVRQLRDYEALYCGLCSSLGRRHGFFARFFLNYDFTFLAMLLDGGDRRRSGGAARPGCGAGKRPVPLPAVWMRRRTPGRF